MKKIGFSLILTSLLLSACGANRIEEITAKDFWARAGMKDGNSAAYMLVQNGTAADDELLGASSDAAQAVELHLSQMKADGTMEMIRQQSIALPAGKTAQLKPGSYHIMLIGLTHGLKAGDEITLTLHFKNQADLILPVPIKDAESMGSGGMDGHTH